MYIYGLAKRKVKMAGYWPSSLFCETEPRSRSAQKRTRPISSHLDRTSLANKAFSISVGFRGNFPFGTQRVGQSGQRHLARSGNQSLRRIGLSCPLTELAIYNDFFLTFQKAALLLLIKIWQHKEYFSEPFSKYQSYYTMHTILIYTTTVSSTE